MERLRRVWELGLATAREQAGRHEYDGRIQDLSADGVRSGLSRLGGTALDDPQQEAQLAAFEKACAVSLGDLETHRRNPRVHLSNLDLSGYSRDYAPPAERKAARDAHVRAWPDAVDAAVTVLDEVAAPVAAALLPSARGLGAQLGPADPESAHAAHRRLVEHLEDAAAHGDPDAALGPGPLAALLSAGESADVELRLLADRAVAERDRLRDLLIDNCGRLRPGVAVEEVMADLVADHPDADGVLAHARELAAETIDFVRERGLIDGLDGQCRVAPSPPARRWATAMLSWPAPAEPDGPSWFYVTPPNPEWPSALQDSWLKTFSRTSLPATAAHEVAPGHFAHGRMLRRVRGEVRRGLFSPAFIEGWAHYGEELCVEEGFRAQDPRFAVGVAMKALLRVTRLLVSIGLHSGAMSLEEAVRQFSADAYVYGAAAKAEANRALFDPTYGRYTWGKLEILALRDDARRRWGAPFTLARFHSALLDLGAPPLGLMGAALGAESD